MKLRIALYAAAGLIIAAALLCFALPAGADYSDHGTPDVSTVASTHPYQPPSGGPLADTGADTDTLLRLGLFAVAVGLILCAASALVQGKRGAR